MEEIEIIRKLEGREIIYPHSIGKKVNEICDTLNLLILERNKKDEEEKE